MHKAKPQASRGFTLLELIIVIAILAILSVAVVLVINPAETLARARDSQRLSDLSAMKSAIGLYMAEVTGPSLDNDATDLCSGFGAANDTIWTSVTLVTDLMGDETQVSSDSGLVDGSGWVPVNLQAIVSGAPLSNWPVDPVNNAQAGASLYATITHEALMYVYDCDEISPGGPFFEFNANMESDRYENTGNSDKESSDGGVAITDDIYEIGTSLTIIGAWTE